MNEKFFKELEEKKVLIAAHRGQCGGNIVENTYLSSITAFQCDADMIELDVSKSTDGVLYAFHDGEEPRKFGFNENIKTLSSETIEKLEYTNSIGEPSGQKVWKLYDLLKALKGKGLINLDRGWDYLEDIAPIVEELEMVDEILIKSPPTDDVVEFLKNHKTKFMYMPIAKTKEDVLKFIHPEINMVAAEIIFRSEEDDIVSDEFINYLKERNICIWVNAITLSVKEDHNLSAYYDDDTSIKNNGSGWNWLMDKKVDIIQTDWPHLLKKYINKKFKGE